MAALKVLPDIKSILNNIHYDKDIKTLSELCELLDRSINLDAPITLHDGDLIKEGYNSELDELKSIRKNSKDFLFDIKPNLKVDAPIITYSPNEDYTDLTQNTSVLVTEQFIQECEQQILKDFYGA